MPGRPGGLPAQAGRPARAGGAEADRAGRGAASTGGPSGVCDRYVGPDASLLVAGFSWLYVWQLDPGHAGQRHAGEPSRFGAGRLVHDAQPDRCHLSSVIVKMILVTYKFDVHPAAAASTLGK